MLLILSMGFSSTTVARALVATTNVVLTNEYGLSGTISQYNVEQSIIRIDGVNYLLKGKGSLTNADLKPLLKIKYNLEQSATEEMGRITRIWIED